MFTRISWRYFEVDADFAMKIDDSDSGVVAKLSDPLSGVWSQPMPVADALSLFRRNADDPVYANFEFVVIDEDGHWEPQMWGPLADHPTRATKLEALPKR